jgi:hypothetical protein
MSRRDFVYATGAYAATRAALVLVAWAALSWLPLELDPGQWQAFPGHLWLDGWARWDSAWYRTVFEDGYSYRPGKASNVAFFPLYPWVSGLLSLPLRGWLGPEASFFLAAIGVAHLSSWLAVLGLHAFARDRLGPAAADRAVWLLCLYPFSFYLGAVYTEGPFLALAIWSFRLADRGRWPAACLLASLAAITRVPGFLVGAALALEYVRRHGPHPGSWGREALAFLATPVPVLLLLGGFAACFGHPLVFATAHQEGWGRHFHVDLPRQLAALGSGELSRAGWSVTAWRVALVSVLPLAVALVWKKLGAPLATYTLLVLGLPAASGLSGLERFYLVAFPIFAALAASLRGRAAWWATIALFVPCLVWFTGQFARWAPMVAGAR